MNMGNCGGELSELQRRISRRKVVREGAFVEAVGQASCEPFRASDCETGGGSKGGGLRADNKQGGKVITLHLAGGLLRGKKTVKGYSQVRTNKLGPLSVSRSRQDLANRCSSNGIAVWFESEPKGLQHAPMLLCRR